MPVKLSKVKVVYDSDMDEWIVKAYVSDGLGMNHRYPAADYFAMDKEDAQESAKAMMDSNRL